MITPDQVYSVTQLAKIVGKSRDWINTQVREQPADEMVETKGNTTPHYKLSTLVQCVLTKADKQDRKSRDRQEDIKAEMMSDELRESRGELFARTDVIRFVSEQFKRMDQTLSGMADQVERECGPDVVVIETIEIQCEEAKVSLHANMMEFLDQE